MGAHATALPMTFLLTALALLAFAGNSLLCRAALSGGSIDPAAFTAIRLTSGALVLWLLARCVGERRPEHERAGSWLSGAALFAYAIAFSFAYVSLPAGVGALVLFGAVQLTMLTFAVCAGQGLRAGQWGGFVVAVAGLVTLVFPGLSTPDPLGVLLMVVAGVAWGVYSIRGRGVAAPIASTAGNFVRAAPFALLLLWPAAGSLHAQGSGIWLALASGVVTSGLGYVIWYRALRGLQVSQAAVVQLLVPVLAGGLGVLLLGEVMTTRLLIGGLSILGGVAVAARPTRR